MIRINLLPRTAVAGAGPSIRNQAIVAGVIVLVAALGLLVFPSVGVFSVTKRISTLEKDIKKADEQLKEVEKYRKRLDEIKTLNKKIEEKLKIIDDIERRRSGPVWLMDNVTDAISRFKVVDNKTGMETWQYLDNKVFLEKLDIQGDGITMEGMALNNTFLVAFLNNLKSMQYIVKDVTLYFSDQTGYSGAIVRKFKITAKINAKAVPGDTTIKAEPDPPKAPPPQKGKAAAKPGKNEKKEEKKP